MEFKVIDANEDILHQAYEAGAGTILDQMSFQVGRVTGSEPKEWCYRVYENGLVVPAPLGIEDGVISEIQLRKMFCKAAERSAEALHMATHGASLPESLVSAVQRAQSFCRPSPIC